MCNCAYKAVDWTAERLVIDGDEIVNNSLHFLLQAIAILVNYNVNENAQINGKPSTDDNYHYPIIK